MMTTHDKISRALAGGLAIAAFVSAGATLSRAVGRNGDPDLTSADLFRFEQARTLLPRQGSLRTIGIEAEGRRYRLAQYALAPLVLSDRPGNQFAIGPSTIERSELDRQHLSFFKDLGNGVALYNEVS